MSKSKYYFVLIVLCQFINLSVKAQFSGGDGSKSDPWQIASLEQLDSVHNHLSGNFILTSDLNFKGSVYDSTNSVNGWISIGTEEEPFIGDFNGNGHIINNLYVRNHNTNYHGLFGYVKNSTIDSLALVNYTVLGSNDIGGLVGEAENSAIYHCYASGYISGHYNVGGVIGTSMSTNISCCYFNGEVIGNTSVGGIIGYAEETNMTQSYSCCYVIAVESEGLLVGSGIGNYFDACYYISSFGDRGYYGVGNLYYYVSDYEEGDNEITHLSFNEMRDIRSFKGFDFVNEWSISKYHSFPALKDMDNIPIVIADTITSLDNLVDEAYDYETGKANLIWNLDSIVSCTSGELFTDTMSLSKYDDWFVYYKVGEVRPFSGDTLWSGISLGYLDVYINNLLNREEVMVYPNPCATRYLYLRYDKTIEVESISLYDMYGKCVFYEEAGVDQILMQHFLSGIYIIKIQTKEGTIFRQILKKEN